MTFPGPLVLLVLASCLAASCDGGRSREKLGGAGPRPPHHGPQGFRNPHLPDDEGRLWDFCRWRLGLGPREAPALPPENVPASQPRVLAPDLQRLQHPDPQVIQVSWIGHETFLIQAAGLNVLTDPIFSARASPLSFLGPRRLAPPGVPFEQLPRIDAVVISHNHYDHLDAPTVTRLGPGPRFFVPLGLGAWFKERGRENVVELDWWQDAVLGPVRFRSVPVQHFSQRTLVNRNQSLWCGWVLETPAGHIFFAGDTGYSPDFAEIGARCNPILLSLLPIGGYQPRWFMQPMHLNPPEAVRVHRDLRSRLSIGMHWGTFQLTDEPLGEPPRYLQQALQEAGLSPEEFITLAIGETRTLR
jgi:N-acyl-phosphatidylethanolamine-hydrolysing phospholipase D